MLQICLVLSEEVPAAVMLTAGCAALLLAALLRIIGKYLSKYIPAVVPTY